MKREYIIPMNPSDIRLEPMLSELAGYSLDIGIIADVCVGSIVGPDADPHGEVIAFLNEAVCCIYEAEPDGGPHELTNAMQESMDKAVTLYFEIEDKLKQHLQPYLFTIENMEAVLGTKTSTMSWDVKEVRGGDLIVEISDED